MDAALIPAFALGDEPGTRAVAGVAIGSDGPVRSVLLYCRRRPGEIRHWAPDPDSLSSNALVLILLAERYGLHPGTASREEADAVLVIGDPALKGLGGSWQEVLDLGEAWRALTGKPFVYAVWAIREGVDAPGLPDLLREAKRNGVAALAASGYGLLPPAELDYLRHAIRYDLGEREREGLDLFLGKARRLGLLSEDPEPVWI
jgi:chorismate dehydratase